MPPTVAINSPTTTIWRGDPVTFTASPVDPDGDAVTLEWAHTGFDATHPMGDRCPADQGAYANPAFWPSSRVAATDYQLLDPVTQVPFCVWAFATDRHGATRAAAPLQVEPRDHLPVAVIDIIESVETAGGFSLYDRLKFSGAASTDEDVSDGPLSYNWGLASRPRGSAIDVDLCADDPDLTFACLTPDVPGEYIVQLTVSDRGGTKSATEVQPVTVAGDQLPCLTMTDPIFVPSISSTPSPPLVKDPRESGIFTVQVVEDDGDPVPERPAPHGKLNYSWFIKRGTDPFEYKANDFPTYVLGADAFTIGDVARVRVEIRDRRPAAVDLALAGCDEDADFCYGNGRAGCTQRVTWRIEYRQ